ncbi:MAG TPA: hypothetical protein VNX70_13975 [Bryobacteraceae bacterium]|nr:hypothetical protein [Bryobacteraceae bacterium]
MKSVPCLLNIKLTRNLATLTAIAVVTFILPGAALADINSNATLSVGQSLNLDTGATNTSGSGDITFTGTSITFIGAAKGGALPAAFGAGQATFMSITQTQLQALAALATTAPISASSLTAGNAAGTIIGAGTNGGNAAKLLVTAISSTSISLQYTTFGASSTGGGGGSPTVTGVTNNYSFIPSGFTNSGVTPSSIITIFGSNMAAPVTGNVTLQSSAGAGIPTTLNGTSVSVTVGGKTLPLGIYYATPSQIAAVLPAATATGTGTITVTYNGTPSNALSITVVASAFGLDTYYGTGSGLITATDARTGALFNYTSSAAPGEIITLWGTGLGADPQDSDTVFSTTPHAVNQAAVQVWIGGVQAAVGYAGSSGYPGLDQINVTIPSGLTGCNVAIVVVVNGVASNFATAPINQGNGVCSDAAFGITGTQYSQLSGQTTVKSGSVFLGQFVSTTSSGTQTQNFASADFQSVTGSVYGSASGIVSVGSCIVTEVISAGGNVSSTGLDPGSVSLAGPGGANYPLMSFTAGSFSALLPAGAITSSGGTYVFSWTGGKDVGASTATVTLPNPLLNWTNESTASPVTRSAGAQVTWTGGAPGTFVFISGSSISNGVTGSFTCYAPQSALQFTVPSYVLGTLPAGTGSLSVENITQYTKFTAPMLDYGIAFGFTGFSTNATYQ